jgi:hypothetical protein
MAELLHIGRILGRGELELREQAMDTNAWLMGLGGALLLAALTWAGAMWWFGRKLLRSTVRAHKLEKARQTLTQQNAQARRQIEHLLIEVAELRRQLCRLDAAKAQQMRVSAASHDFTDSGPFVEAAEPVETPADGFADTHFFMPKKL